MSSDSTLVFGVRTNEAVQQVTSLHKALTQLSHQLPALATAVKASSRDLEGIGKSSEKAASGGGAKKLAKQNRELADSMESVAIATMRLKSGPLTHNLKVMSDSTSQFAADIQKSTAAATKDLDAYVKEQARLQNVAAAQAKAVQQTVAQITEKDTAQYKRGLKARAQSAKAAFGEMLAAEDAHNKNVAAARAKALQQTVAGLTGNESKQRKDELSALRKAIEEEASVRAAGLKRREASLKAQKALTDHYNGMELAAQVRHLERMQRVIAAGDTPITRVARRFGVSAMRDYSNLETMKAQVEAQKQAEQSARSLASGTKSHANATVAQRQAMATATAGMREMHSAARGLAGSLNMLWLTWGSLAPLAGGAAIGGMVRGAYQTGKDLEYQLKFVEALGNEAVGVNEMMPSVLGSMFKPTEVAQGMRQLAQAGLDTNEALGVLTPTLQLATLGEMSVADAALTATSALAAFSLNVSDASKVGDVFAKAAAISNTSVSGIAEAMKQAASSSGLYGVSIEETTAALTELAKQGIFGSAAGTAIKNLQREIYAPTEKGLKALQSVGVKAFDDVTGKARSFTDLVTELSGVVASMSQQDAATFLGDVFNERAVRAASILFRDPQGFRKALEEIQSAEGFLAEANAKMLDTVEGAQNRLQSTLQQSFVKAFDKTKNDVRNTLAELDNTFASEGFVNSVTMLTRAVAELTSFVAGNIQTITAAIAIYMGMKTALGALTLGASAYASVADLMRQRTQAKAGAVIADTAATNANTVAQVANNAATNAGVAGKNKAADSVKTAASRVSTFTSVLGMASRALGAVGLALSAGTLLYQLYAGATRGATAAGKDYSAGLAQSINMLAQENAQLNEKIRLRREEMALGSGAKFGEDKRALSEYYHAVKTIPGEISALEQQGKNILGRADGGFWDTVPVDKIIDLNRNSNRIAELRKREENLKKDLPIAEALLEKQNRDIAVDRLEGRQQGLYSQLEAAHQRAKVLEAKAGDAAANEVGRKHAAKLEEAMKSVREAAIVDTVSGVLTPIKPFRQNNKEEGELGVSGYTLVPQEVKVPKADAESVLNSLQANVVEKTLTEFQKDLPNSYTGPEGGGGGAGRIYSAQTAQIQKAFQARNQLLVSQRNHELKMIEDRRKVGMLNDEDAASQKDSVWANYEKGFDSAGQAALSALAKLKAPKEELAALSESMVQQKLEETRATYEQAQAQQRELDLHNAEVESFKTLTGAAKDSVKARLDVQRALKEQQDSYAQAYMANEDLIALEARNMVDDEYSNVLDKLQANLEMLTEVHGKANVAKVEDYQATLAAIEATKQEIEVQKELAAVQAQQMWIRENTVAAGLARGFQGYANDIKRIGDHTANATGNVLKSLEDGLTDVFAKGKFDARSFGDVVIQELSRIMAKQAMMNLLGERAGGSGDGLIGGLFNAGMKLIGMGGGDMPVNTVDTGANFGSFPVAHGGGIAGGHAARSRAADASIFHGAPRFHTGGIIGAGEVPIIAQRGEGVFTPEQMKNLAPAGSAPTIVINQTVQVDSRADRASIIQGMQAAKASAMKEIAEQFHRDGPMRRIAT